MTKELKVKVFGYIERSISDIARKCGITTDEVKSILYELNPQEDDFVIITWPEIQDFMNVEGFEENSCLLNTEPMLTEYGSSAYFVRKEWLKQLLS